MSRAYLPRARRWWRVRRSSLRCFFFRIRFLRFLISEPMALGTIASGSERMRTRDLRFGGFRSYPVDGMVPAA